MNIKAQLLAEHSKTNILSIAHYIGNDTDRFQELMTLFFEGTYRVSQRAAWAVSHCAEGQPALIQPYLEKMIENLRKKGLHNAVKRNTVRLLQDVEIPEGLHGEAIDVCFHLLADKNEPVAIKAFSMTVLFNLVQNEPDLKRELKILIEDQMPYAKAAFQSRGRKILKEL